MKTSERSLLKTVDIDVVAMVPNVQESLLSAAKKINFKKLEWLGKSLKKIRKNTKWEHGGETNSKGCLNDFLTAFGLFRSKLLSKTILGQKIMIERLWVCENEADSTEKTDAKLCQRISRKDLIFCCAFIFNVNSIAVGVKTIVTFLDKSENITNDCKNIQSHWAFISCHCLPTDLDFQRLHRSYENSQIKRSP